jgi:hypothetical protein
LGHSILLHEDLILRILLDHHFVLLVLVLDLSHDCLLNFVRQVLVLDHYYEDFLYKILFFRLELL